MKHDELDNIRFALALAEARIKQLEKIIEGLENNEEHF